VDLDPAALAFASAAVSDDRVTWHEADATQLPFESSTADLVVCNQGLQFFPDRPAVLAEVLRVLRPGGRLALAVWGPLAANPWPAAMAGAIGDALGEEARQATESVCGLGDAAEVHGLLVGGGFVDVEITDVELTANHPDVRDAIDGQLAAVPSAGSIEALGGAGRMKLIDAMAVNLDDYTSSDGGLSVPSTSVLAAAAKPS
jgi:SAM-dependent methyltransferase